MNSIVIGLGFGDEGKGIFTDYLCSQAPESLVVRFSGGHQAGHTVVSGGFRHVFSNFGSGSFRNVPTYWSKYCTIEPIGLLKELEILKYKGVNPTLYIDERCPITTPYDMISNRKSEEINSHGSCGVGFGSTINREENFYSLTFGDLFYPRIFYEKLEMIKNFYKILFDTFELTIFLENCKKLINNKNIIKVYEYLDNKNRRSNEKENRHYYPNCIFEGSQGLLLDQHFGFFPNVTRSNTGCKNAVDIMNGNDFEVFLITRAYQTRHGNGFMTNENIPHNIKPNKLETNVTHEYQGEFRRSLLDVSLLEYTIKKDEHIRKANNLNLVITCLDHIKNEYRFTYKSRIQYCSNENDFVDKIQTILNIKNVYLSKSNDSKNIKKWRKNE